MTEPVIAVTPGDCTGIGPEILARVLAHPRGPGDPRLVVVGDRRVMDRAFAQTGVSVRLEAVPSPKAVNWQDENTVPILDLANTDPALFPQGLASAESGRLTGETLARAVELSQGGEVDAVSFAPLNKRAMFDGGWRFPDEHKMFAHLLGHTTYFSEMNVLEGWWMSRVTSHVSLREALDGVTGPAIRDAIRLCDRMMRRAGVERPRIAVAALNPHGGENGLFGREEIEVIRPAVEAAAREDGIGCEGPFPADTVYVKAFGGAYDGVVSLYHDQGQIATKLKGFNRGVTVTAGLDTVFTTPAHGTAFDIAGQGIADPGALHAAIRLAQRLAASNVEAKTA
ncbi:PdxA family dehydrogenase [Aureimonas jatrophae]|uniref:4-hydroxythreonine-4-phosphate dehydrogenase n=1 Tax=Aureimonas jatrophae TaxID=1166073 RepID=A0A1H0FQT6_9HYPH|nr:4-hydroxythreonine-4-phosphate dehydrogenase PdxA [Aureimonas jatrophae]MBB3949907.1 4-hydroxythreonine-4-phosphate dehydrogenase [Aureimonas jatrophae]SDN96892.1 4-hydroxythreonine-4-phosphate dehydrogenase [Aureimonas jatrophae]